MVVYWWFIGGLLNSIGDISEMWEISLPFFG